ncbi:MAG: SelB C-terminal domain-containing protein, partial [Terriglobia bacterium]
VHSNAARALSQAILQILSQFHDRNPLLHGVSKEQLRSQARVGPGRGSAAASQLLFDASLRELAAGKKIVIEDQTVRLPGRAVTLNAEELAAKQEITRAFETAGLRVPPSSDVLASLRIDRARAEKILQILLKEKVLQKVAEGLIFHHSALERLLQVVREVRQKSGRLSVAAFKELTGVSRKYAIPLLEYLDRERVTRRSGDERIIL